MPGKPTIPIAAVFLLVLALFVRNELRAAPVPLSPVSAASLVSAAIENARAGRKAVLIEFGASWCTWCKRFDAFVHAPEVSQIIADNYVVVNLTVQERDDKKALENPGGQDAMNNWGGADAGLPFYVFLNAAGLKIADSKAMPDGTNIGFPGNNKELQAFVGLIDKTAPRLRRADRTKLVDYLHKTVPE